MKNTILVCSSILYLVALTACGSDRDETVLEEDESSVQGTCASATATIKPTAAATVIDGDLNTSYNFSNNWQTVTIDLGCRARISGLRRHMTRIWLGASRVNQGESISYSTNNSSWTQLTGTNTFGWTAYNNYVPHAWHSVSYGWSRWLRPKKPVEARYIQFSWDGNSDALSELEVSIRTITNSATASGGTTAWDVIDGNTSTGLLTTSTNWQDVTVDLGRPVLFSRLRRHMSANRASRGNQGEQVQVSADGTTYRALVTADVAGWEAYNNYVPRAWHTLPYGWSEWLRVRDPQPVRYVRFLWDGANDSLDELELDYVADAGDPGYDFEDDDPSFWSSVASGPFRTPGPIVPTMTLDQLRRQIGMTGSYDGEIYNRTNTSSPSGRIKAHLNLVETGGEVRGVITVLQDGLTYNGGFWCGDTALSAGSQFQVHMEPWTYDGRFPSMNPAYNPLFHIRVARQGSTSRHVSGFAVSGDVDTTVTALLQTGNSESYLAGDVSIVTPSPCNDATLEVFFVRRDNILMQAYGY